MSNNPTTPSLNPARIPSPSQTKLRVLIVEDRLDELQTTGKTIREEIQTALMELPVIANFAVNKSQARTAIRDSFFHVALVDHDLGGGAFGKEVLELVKKDRPSCLRVLVTREPELDRKGGDVLYQALMPFNQVADGLVFRQVAEYDEIIKSLLKMFDHRSLRIIDSSDRSVVENDSHLIVKQIAERVRPASSISFTSAELAHVMGELFLDRKPIGDDIQRMLGGNDDVEAIEVKPMDGGRSRSLVLRCIPKTRSGHNGPRFAVKIGPRAEGDEELRRFNRYVRFYRTTQRRVELIGESHADGVTSICYSFAGGGIGDIISVQKLFEEQSIAALLAVSNEFNPAKREWYKQVVPYQQGHELAAFFQDIHFRDRTTWQSTLAEVNEVLRMSNLLRVPPRWHSDVAFGLKKTTSHTCIVHGDLNAGNLLVGTDGQTPSLPTSDFINMWLTGFDLFDEQRLPKVIMIDYRHTERGPIFLDFAHLELSIRLLPSQIDHDDLDMETCFKEDAKTQELVWGGTPEDDALRERLSELTYEQLASYVLGRLARRNFELHQNEWGQSLHTSSWRRQYAATCILLGLHLWKFKNLGRDIVPINTNVEPRDFKDLSIQARRRIASWIYAQSAHLTSSDPH